MGTRVLAVALCLQLAIPTIGTVNVGSLALSAKVSTLTTMRADILGALATGAVILRYRRVLCDEGGNGGIRRRGGRRHVCDTREVQGRWHRDWDVHLTFQILGHNEARGFWKDLGTGMGVKTREPHLVMLTSELSL